MSTPPPAPTSSTPEKKGLTPMAWVAIGCGCLVLLAGGCTVVGTFFAAKVGSDFVEEYAENPGLLAAEMIVRANPDLELLDSDAAAGTVTIRNRDNEVVTVDIEDLQEGRISFETTGADGESQSFEISADEGSVTMQDGDGNTTFEVGEQTASDLPDWVPVYPGTEPKGAFAMNQGGAANGTFHLETTDSGEQILDFYRQQMETLGFETTVSQISGSSSQVGGVVAGEERDGDRNLSVVISSERDVTNIVVTYAESS